MRFTRCVVRWKCTPIVCADWLGAAEALRLDARGLQTPYMSQLVPQRQLKSLGLEHVNSTLAAALQAPPTARRTFGRVIDGRHNRWSPSWALEAAAAQRLIELGFMGGLLDCCSIFFTIAHADDPDANKLLAVKLMFHRKDLRCDTRPQALGKSGLGVDLDIYLRQLILDKFGTTLDAIFEEFFAESGYNEKHWYAEQVRSEPTPRPPPTHHPHAWHPPTHGTQHAPSSHSRATVACRSLLGQMLRVVVRFGILQRVFSPKVAAWALCFFGTVWARPLLACHISSPDPDTV